MLYQIRRRIEKPYRDVSPWVVLSGVSVVFNSLNNALVAEIPQRCPPAVLHPDPTTRDLFIGLGNSSGSQSRYGAPVANATSELHAFTSQQLRSVQPLLIPRRIEPDTPRWPGTFFPVSRQ